MIVLVVSFGPEGVYWRLLGHLVVVASDEYILVVQNRGRCVCFLELVLVLVANNSHELYIFGVRMDFVNDASSCLIEARVA